MSNLKLGSGDEAQFNRLAGFRSDAEDQISSAGTSASIGASQVLTFETIVRAAGQISQGLGIGGVLVRPTDHTGDTAETFT